VKEYRIWGLFAQEKFQNPDPGPEKDVVNDNAIIIIYKFFGSITPNPKRLFAYPIANLRQFIHRV